MSLSKRKSFPDVEMSPEHERHLQHVLNRTTDAISTKYRAGQTEHGGKLWEIDCLAEAQKEAVDLVVYLQTEADRKHACRAVIETVIASGDLKLLPEALKFL